LNHEEDPSMTDQPRPDGRVVRGKINDALIPDDSLLLEWLRRVMKPEVFDGDTVVLPREPMDGLIEMARNRGFVIDTQDG
jgi:hypothetical protein